MAVEVDYYGVLGIAKSADREAVEAAVKKSMREWRKRTEAADIGVRQEAELKVKWIEEARTTLLDPAKRQRYDSVLSSEGVKQKATAASQGAGSWLERAQEYLARGDYSSAGYAAREATQAEGNNPRCWWVRSRANEGLDRLEDAIFEAMEAVKLDDRNAEYHFNAGCIYEKQRSWDHALKQFTRAANLDQANPLYQLSVGGVYLQNGMPEKALTIIESVHADHPDDETTTYYLGMALIDVAENVPKKQVDGGYIVTSADEIARMRQFATRALNLRNVPADIKESARHILDYRTRMEKKTLRVPEVLMAGAAGGFEAGFGAGCLGAMIVGAIMCLPLILVLYGFSAISGSGILWILLGGGLGYLWWMYAYVPQWKKNL